MYIARVTKLFLVMFYIKFQNKLILYCWYRCLWTLFKSLLYNLENSCQLLKEDAALNDNQKV